jgi:signal transduction histidine kinase
MSGAAIPRRFRELLDAVLTIASDLDLRVVLERIVQSAAHLVDARYGALGVLDATGTRLAEFITVGVDDRQRERIGPPPDGHGILGLLIVDDRPLRLADLRDHPASAGFPPGHPPMGSFLGVPVRLHDEVFGNIYLTDKMTAAEFSADDEELLVALAGAAAMAIENARLSMRVRELAVLEDRERIARDLHDTVIQRLFATALTLQGTARLVGVDPPRVAERIEAAVDDLDLTVRQIRTAIFGLGAAAREGTGLRDRVLAAIVDAETALGFRPAVEFAGAVDSAIGAQISDEVVAVVREALSNVARHACAGSASVAVLLAGGVLTVSVADDGVGPPGTILRHGHGMENMSRRAERLGGTFAIERRATGGTALTWQVPAH